MAERIKSSFSRFITKSSAERKTIKKIEKLVKETQQAELTPEKIKSIRRNASALSKELRNEAKQSDLVAEKKRNYMSESANPSSRQRSLMN